LSRVRHDLRSPLGEILGYSEMLEEDVIGTPQAKLAEALRAIHRSASLLLRCVDERLTPEAIQSQRADLADLEREIQESANQIAAAGDDLSQQCARTQLDALAADVARISASARRLQTRAPVLLAQLHQGQAATPTPGGESGSETMFWTAPGAAVALAEGTVLVVEDNESNSEMLRRRLLRQGYKVEVAENGRRALELLLEQKFDLVLLDIVMPEIDGYQVLEQMKADMALRHIPVIMISALDEVETLVRCIQKGADDYLTKPFDPVLLRARIGACLEKKRLRDREVSYLQEIEIERRRSDELLRVILPDDIAAELKASGSVKPRRHENVGVLFCDVVGFTAYCSIHTPEEVMGHLQSHIKAFEEIAAEHGLEKIKTIGDAFMAASGLLAPEANPALNCIRCGLAMVEATKKLSTGWRVHIGIHAGPVIAGVVGNRKYLFDIWGDTVNTAARVTSVAGPGAVCASASAWQQARAECEGASRGWFKLKGKEQLEIFEVRECRRT
jgi:class 3 adenylate cyclase/CheY-like chemotaxis protein